MIQIRLGHYEPVDPATDPLGREHIGFCDDMTEEHAWQVGRGVWKLAAQRVLEEDEVQIVNLGGAVLAGATITGISKHGVRQAIEGTLRLGDPRVGKPTTTPHRSRNSVGYFRSSGPTVTPVAALGR
jgi:hypothetical protein